jgi:hypothetical protein
MFFLTISSKTSLAMVEWCDCKNLKETAKSTYRKKNRDSGKWVQYKHYSTGPQPPPSNPKLLTV